MRWRMREARRLASARRDRWRAPEAGPSRFRRRAGQHGRTHSRLYWLAVIEDAQKPGTKIAAHIDGQHIVLEQAVGVSAVRVRLNDAMLNLDNTVTVTHEGLALYEGQPVRTIANLANTPDEREDPQATFSAEVIVRIAPQSR